MMPDLWLGRGGDGGRANVSWLMMISFFQYYNICEHHDRLEEFFGVLSDVSTM